jgi:bifunctional non-homologous end joining protein LigD
MENLFNNSGETYTTPSTNAHLNFKPITMRNKWRFVIKKHRATRLHYDFRLEFPGVLKSWVIDLQGPPMKANESRKLVMVGDHNPEFIYREGIIPEGKYGAGEMIVYDRGVYFPKFGGTSKSLDREVLNAMLKSGELDFFLMGYKLKGKFRLIKTNADKSSWLLIKTDDIYCTDEDMTKLDKSVITGKTLFDIRNGNKANILSDPDLFSA